MSEWTLEEALKLAVSMEEESMSLYASAQDKVVNPGSRQFLKELVVEERSHKDKILQAMQDPDKIEEVGPLDKQVLDLKIVDGLEPASLSPEADYQDILIYAAKREKATHDFYIAIAKKYREKKIGNVFTQLAREELRHKYRLEAEYDEYVLKWM